MLQAGVKVTEVDTYRSQPKVNTNDDMARVVFTLPLWLWKRSCRILGVDPKGNSLEGCGNHGCKVAAPKGMATNGPCTCK